MTVKSRMQAECSDAKIKSMSPLCQDCQASITVTADEWKDVKDIPEGARRQALINLAGQGGKLGCKCDVQSEGEEDGNGDLVITCTGRNPTSGQPPPKHHNLI